MELKKLSKDTIQLVSSSQVITSPYSVVKELVENALDAKASSVDVRLENFGLDLIQVRDNGIGIRKTEVPLLATPHCTSKLNSFQELSSLTSYGFRGEALSSIANIADLSVTTATKDDRLAHVYTIDHNGRVTGTQPSSLGVGTTVAVSNLFKNFPVRRKVYRNKKTCAEDLKRVEQVLMAFGLAFPCVRFSLRHNKIKTWDKEQAIDMKANVSLILGPLLSQQLMPINYQCFNPMVKLQVYAPKPSADLSQVSRSKPDRLFTLVNCRPVEIKTLSKVVREAFIEAFPSETGRWPVAVVMISVLPEDVDVNLEPNKTRVLLHHIDFITTTLSSLLTQAYGPCKVPSSGDPSTSKPGNTRPHKPDSVSKRLEDEASSPSQRRSEDLLSKDDSSQEENSSPSLPVEGVASGSDKTIISRQPSSSCVHECVPQTKQSVGQSVDNSHPHNGSSSRTDQSTTSSCSADKDDPLSVHESSPSTQFINEAADTDDLAAVDVDSYSLLDISELEKDFFSSGGEEEVPVEVGEEPPVGKDGQTTSELKAGTRQASLLSWSRGEALTDAAKRPVEPVRVLGGGNTAQTRTAGDTHSKLSQKKPTAVFDMVHSRPVKRTAASLEGDRPAKKPRDHLSTPSLDRFLSRTKQVSTSEVEGTFELDKIAKRNELLWKQRRRPAVACDRVVGSCQCLGEADVWVVLLKGTLAKFNVDRLPDAPFILSRAKVEACFTQTLKKATSSIDLLTKTPFFQGIHTIDRLDGKS